jgi:hypothetical protein
MPVDCVLQIIVLNIIVVLKDYVMNWEHIYLLLGIFVAGFMLLKKLRENRIGTLKQKADKSPKQENAEFNDEEIEKPERAEIGLGHVTVSKALIGIMKKNYFLGIFILLIFITGVPVLFVDGFLDGGFERGVRNAIPLTITALIMATILALFAFLHKFIGPKAAVVFCVVAFIGVPGVFVLYVIMNWGT